MELVDGDELVDADILTERGDANGQPDGTAAQVLAVTAMGHGKRILASAFRVQRRGGMGSKALKFKDVDDRLVALRACSEDGDVLLSTAKGTTVRQMLCNISQQSRTAKGVVVQRLDAGDRVANVAILPREGKAGVNGKEL